jgi:hypothetical protein
VAHEPPPFKPLADQGGDELAAALARRRGKMAESSVASSVTSKPVAAVRPALKPFIKPSGGLRLAKPAVPSTTGSSIWSGYAESSKEQASLTVSTQEETLIFEGMPPKSTPSSWTSKTICAALQEYYKTENFIYTTQTTKPISQYMFWDPIDGRVRSIKHLPQSPLLKFDVELRSAKTRAVLEPKAPDSDGLSIQELIAQNPNRVFY